MNFWKKLAGYMPILSAVFVVACVGISLRGYAAPVYEIEEPETIQTVDEEAGKAAEKVAETLASVAAGNFDLADGIYQGSGTGFAGTVTVSVEIKDKSIVAIHILSNQDDAAFFNRAMGVIDEIIAGQTLEVDVVSGATYSSNGIISAVKNALTGEEDTSTPAASSAGSGQGSTSVSTVEDASAYKDGTYYGSGTGFAGTIRVKVVIADGKINDISIESHSDGSSYMSSASTVIDRIISAQSTNVDTVSGATYSSVGIIQAVRDALKDAAVSSDANGETEGETEETQQTETITGTIPYVDGIYYGTGEGYLGDITLAVVIQDQIIKAILITENEDDEAFFNRAKAIIHTVLQKQTVDIDAIDTVSGATYSSRGILEALKAAMKAADEATNGKTPDSTETEAPAQTETETGETADSESESETEGAQSLYIDGDYEETVLCSPDEDEDFEAYYLTMTVTIQNDRITAVTNISGDGDASNDSYIKRAAEGTSSKAGVVTQIVDKGLPEGIDTVSRATCSSDAIIEGCRQALEDARRPAETEAPAETETSAQIPVNPPAETSMEEPAETVTEEPAETRASISAGAASEGRKS